MARACCCLEALDAEEEQEPLLGKVEASDVALVTPPHIGYRQVLAAGAQKAKVRLTKSVPLGILAGIFIGFGCYLMVSVGANCPDIKEKNPGLYKMILGAFGLPFGLMLVVVTGADLFTSNCATLTIAVLEGQAGLSQLAQSWVVSYLSNFVGSMLIVGIVIAGDTLGAGAETAASLAQPKCELSFGNAFARAILANYLVCLAVYMATFARDLASKMVAIWFPISAFIAMGLEHSIANMFIIPVAILAGAPSVSWGQFFMNELAVTLGNIVGGALFVGGAFWWVYGSCRWGLASGAAPHSK